MDKKKPTICFITPPSPFLLDERVFPALGVLKVAAVMKAAGYEVSHLDLNGVVNYEQMVNESTVADVVAITATTPQMPSAFRIAAKVRMVAPQSKIVLGGPHPTLVHAAYKKRSMRAIRPDLELLNKFDCVVYGDGEKALKIVLSEWPYMPMFMDADDPKSDLWVNEQELDSNPFPARELVELSSYGYDIDGVAVTPLISQLGCPMGCRFCAGRSSPMLRRMRLRSSERVVEEIKHLHEHYGYKGFMFFDDELNINKQFSGLLSDLWALQEDLGVDFKCRGFVKAELFTEEQAKEMHMAGFRTIMCGFESGNERVLKNIKKNATKDDNTRVMEYAAKWGLKVKALMSIGHPGETEQTVQDTVDWLCEVAPSDFDVTIITPYPGSPYYDEGVNNGQQQEHRRMGEESLVPSYAYTTPNGDRLYMCDVDYSRDADYYKGAPGDYRSHVWTDELTRDDIVTVRDQAEREVRSRLGLAWNPSAASRVFEASMGNLPGSVYRRSEVGE